MKYSVLAVVAYLALCLAELAHAQFIMAAAYSTLALTFSIHMYLDLKSRRRIKSVERETEALVDEYVNPVIKKAEREEAKARN